MRWWMLLLALGVLALWFGTLDMRHLVRSDEGRYAEIAREMFASGDWVTPRYNDLKYFEKPPLHLWMTALAYESFGVGEWQARLWVALCGALGIGALAFAAHRWSGTRGAWLAGGVLLGTPSWVLAAHFNSLDMSVAGPLTLTLAAVLLAQHPRASVQARRGWMLLAWAAMAAAILTKGLIGVVLPGAACFVYFLLSRDWALIKRLHVLSGAAVLLAVAAPWFVLVSLRNPEFAHFFFIHEHFERYTSSVHQRGAPWWFFVPQLAGGFLPWLALAPAMLRLLWADLRAAGPSGGFRPELFCAAWAGAIFVFFSMSGSKLPGYIVPMFPALAWLAGHALLKLHGAAWRRQLAWQGLVYGLLLVFGLLMGRALGPAPLQDYGPWIAAAACAALLLLGWAWWAYTRQRLLASMGAAALAGLTATTLGLLGHETLGRAASGVDLVPAIEARLTPQTRIYGVRLLDHTLPFYLRRTTIMVEQPDELEFGTRQEPARWVSSLEEFRRIWEGHAPALALMSPDTFDTLGREGWVLCRVAGDARRVVVSNPAVKPQCPAP